MKSVLRWFPHLAVSKAAMQRSLKMELDRAWPWLSVLMVQVLNRGRCTRHSPAEPAGSGCNYQQKAAEIKILEWERDWQPVPLSEPGCEEWQWARDAEQNGANKSLALMSSMPVWAVTKCHLVRKTWKHSQRERWHIYTVRACICDIPSNIQRLQSHYSI